MNTKKLLRLVTITVVLFLAACSTANPQDPLEPYNRFMYAFNKTVDKIAIRPAAIGYKAVTPWFVRDGVTNFFSNLNQLPTIANDVLQLEPYHFLEDAWRFAVNSTFGILGLFDVGTRIGLQWRRSDFGLTMKKWGYESSAYFVIPILGSSTIRDTIGMPVDYYLFSVLYVDPPILRHGLRALDIINRRSGVLKLDDVINQSFDPYVFERNAYLQRRRKGISYGVGVTPYDDTSSVNDIHDDADDWADEEE